MAIPKNRIEFREYCLKKLGKPVTYINVADEQIDDRIDDALQMYYEYHFDGKESTFIMHTITSQDVTNGYLSLPDTVFGVVNVLLNNNASSMGSGIFNVEFQILQSDYINSSGIFSFAGQMTDYYIVKRHLNLMDFMLNGPVLYDYNRKTNKLYIHKSNAIVQGENIFLKVYTMFPKDSNGDPIAGQTFSNIWNDEWFKKYAVELIRQQWGQNLGKFSGVLMPGGVSINGLELYDRASSAIEKLEKELKDSLQEPVDFFMA